MNFYHILTMSMTLLICTGCANTRNQGELWSYGKFCGPGKPEIQASSKKMAISKLRSIDPEDDNDNVCKLHAICYAKYGDFNSYCDSKLKKRLNQMSFIGENSSECTNVAEQIYLAFDCTQAQLRSINSDGEVDHLKLIIGTIVSIYPDGLLCGTRALGGLLFNGPNTPDSAGKCNLRTSLHSMFTGHSLIIGATLEGFMVEVTDTM